MNYEDDLRIDDLNLDQECIEQPVTFMKYSELANEAQKELNNLKDFLSVEKGRIEMEIRSGVLPAPDGVKLTEGSIKAMLESNGDLKKLKEEVNQKKWECDDLNSAVSAFDQRKHAIANCIHLIKLGYNSDPYQKNDYDENVSQRAERNRNKQ